MELEKTSLFPGPGEEAESLLHTGFWGTFKSHFSWVPVRYRYSFTVDDEERSGSFLTLTRRLSAGVSLTYVPPGFAGNIPVSSIGDFLRKLGGGLKAHLPKSTVFLRLDVPWMIADSESMLSLSRQAESAGYRKAPGDVQPPDTVILDVTPDENQILSGMKKKTRYNIRLAGKKGVELEVAGPELLREWYTLYEETARRDRIVLHNYRYYQTLFELAERDDISDAPKLHLIAARHNGELLAGNIAAFTDSTAVYLYGASSGNKRNLMPAYALQWETIRKAREYGCGQYDLFGIPPADDPNHPMHGLYRFKTGFGGEILHRAGAWDFVTRRGMYKAYRGAESARTWYYKRFRKKFSGT
ncbi:MAG: lipid II:glycine glycyltransferase FemX [Spirochaetia bacterium]